MKKSVRFDAELTIQEYEIILGDNPSVSAGAPIQISWEPMSTTKRNFALFEYCRKPSSSNVYQPLTGAYTRRRHGMALQLSAEKRTQLLLDAGYTAEEIETATLEAERVRNNRTETFSRQGWGSLASMLARKGRLPQTLVKGLLGKTSNFVSKTSEMIVSKGLFVAHRIVPQMARSA